MDVTVQEVRAEIRPPQASGAPGEGSAPTEPTGLAERDRLVSSEAARRSRHELRREAY